MSSDSCDSRVVSTTCAPLFGPSVNWQLLAHTPPFACHRNIENYYLSSFDVYCGHSKKLSPTIHSEVRKQTVCADSQFELGAMSRDTVQSSLQESYKTPQNECIKPKRSLSLLTTCLHGDQSFNPPYLVYATSQDLRKLCLTSLHSCLRANSAMNVTSSTPGVVVSTKFHHPIEQVASIPVSCFSTVPVCSFVITRSSSDFTVFHSYDLYERY